MAAYFAELQNNIVQRVVSATEKQWCVDNLGGEWVQTYYSTEGKNYAGIGHTYVPLLDNFHSPQEFNGWYLDENLQWKPPIEYPNDGGIYAWDNEGLMWNEITI